MDILPVMATTNQRNLDLLFLGWRGSWYVGSSSFFTYWSLRITVSILWIQDSQICWTSITTTMNNYNQPAPTIDWSTRGPIVGQRFVGKQGTRVPRHIDGHSSCCLLRKKEEQHILGICSVGIVQFQTNPSYHIVGLIGLIPYSFGYSILPSYLPCTITSPRLWSTIWRFTKMGVPQITSKVIRSVLYWHNHGFWDPPF